MPSDIEVTDELRLAFDEATGQLDPNPELLSALKRRHSQRQHRRRAVLVSVTATVAVNVTDWPNTLGLAEDTSDVVVAPWLTVCARPDEVEVVKLLSPP